MGQLQPGKQEVVPVELASGFVSDTTEYAAGGRWWDGDGVRFRKGYPEKIGGWTRLLPATWRGTCRNIFSWSDLSARNRLALGTSERAMVYDNSSGTLVDATPIEASVALGVNPFSSTAGSSSIVVTHPSHGAFSGRFVRLSGANGFSGLAAGSLTGEFQVTVLTLNTYRITVGQPAISTSTGGGATVAAAFVVSSFAEPAGWGTGPWGAGPWGSGSPSAAATFGPDPALWSFDNCGEDRIINARGKGVYYYDVTTPNLPAVNISTLPGASDTPAAATQILVDGELRIVLALGSAPIGTGIRDPMFIRWGDRGSVVNYSVGPSSTAGGFRLASGSRIICGIKTRRETLVFTDTTLYSLQATGGTSIYKPVVLAQNTSVVGPNAQVVDQADTVYWMARGNFFRYNGRAEILPCDITDRIFDDINYGLASNIVCGCNPKFDEIWWMYPSLNSSDNDKYAIFNYAENTWTSGSVVKRTAWLSSPTFDNPLAAGPLGLYQHEDGYDDADDGTARAIPTFIYSAPTEVDDGNFVVQVDRIIPDISYGTTPPSVTPAVTFSITAGDWPGSERGQSQGSLTLAGVKSGDVRGFTEKLDIRVRGRKFGLRVDNQQLGVFWRLGKQRVRVKMDGQR